MITAFTIVYLGMYVCCCFAVTEAQVDAAIREGAHTRQAVTRACRAGGDCGACHGMIETKIEDHLEELDACARDAVVESGPQLVSAEALVARAQRDRGGRAA
ncbi:MAG: hypothetical protein JWP97_401 [Labilithrix sp.]|nr:hypothetical protein [Labilithrix sp.]